MVQPPVRNPIDDARQKPASRTIEVQYEAVDHAAGGGTMVHAQQDLPEDDARAIVEATLGVSLTHADSNGDVDYRFTMADGKRSALEVTTVTDPRNKIARDQGSRSRRT